MSYIKLYKTADGLFFLYKLLTLYHDVIYGGVILNIEKIRKRFIPMSETMFYILFSLQEERHGYAVMQYVKELTKDRIILGAGTIYQSLGKLESDGLITQIKEEDRKKVYKITEIGTQILLEEVQCIKEIYHNVEGLLCNEKAIQRQIFIKKKSSEGL